MNNYWFEVQELQVDSPDDFLFFTLHFKTGLTLTEKFELLRYLRAGKIIVDYKDNKYKCTMNGRMRDSCITIGCKNITNNE